MTQLAAGGARGIILSTAPKMSCTVLVRQFAVPDRLQRLYADIADSKRTRPVQETEADGAVTIDRHGIENIRAHRYVLDGIPVDALGNLDAGPFLHIEGRPAWSKVLNEYPIGDVPEGLKEALLIFSGKDVSRNFDAYLATTLSFVQPADVVHKSVKVHTCFGERPILLGRHAVDRNVNAINARL